MCESQDGICLLDVKQAENLAFPFFSPRSNWVLSMNPVDKQPQSSRANPDMAADGYDRRDVDLLF